MNLAQKLFSVFSAHERRQAGFLFLAMLLGACLEGVGVGIILPFISLINRPELLQKYPEILDGLARLGVRSPQQILIAAGVGLFAVYVIKNAYLAQVIQLQYRFIYDGQARLSSRILDGYMRSPWTFHLQRNTAELLRNIITEVSLVFGNVLNPLMVLLTEALVVLAVVGVLMIVDPTSALASVLLLGGLSFVFYRIVEYKTARLGKEQQRLGVEMIKWVNQGLGGVKESRVLGREGYFVDAHRASSAAYARAMRYLATVSQLPRLYLETLVAGGILLLLGIAMVRHEGSEVVVPTLALFGAAAFRLLPSVNRIIASITNIRYHESAVEVIHRDLGLMAGAGAYREVDPSGPGGELLFAHDIELRDVGFQYPESNVTTLNGVSLVIPKGSAVALVGPSGAGKTTLVDVLLGLLQPTSGAVFVDGQDVHAHLRSWQRRIGYIPQVIYLSDDTLRRNVAFGVPDLDIDDEKVWKVLESAQLADLVRAWPDGLNAVVGERGVRLSGGQRQRIGIARALYHDPEVLVLDEATSSLDVTTEQDIMNAIESLTGEKTLIVIAHRLSTVERCDRTYWIRDGRIERAERLHADECGAAAVTGPGTGASALTSI